MAKSDCEIVIVGPAGTKVSVIERVSMDTDPMPEPFFEGAIGQSGELSVSVPRAVWVVRATGYGTQRVEFAKGETAVRVTLD